jgi:hypothetical protein
MVNQSEVASTPLTEIQTKEFIESVLKTGSLISMIENKKLNSTALFSLLLQNKVYQKIFVEITCCGNFAEAAKLLLFLNPSLLKSKITKATLKKINNGKSNLSYRSRKTSL